MNPQADLSHLHGGTAFQFESELLTIAVCVGLIIATYAIARLFEISVPHKHGHTPPVVKVMSGVFLGIIVILTAFLIVAAINAFAFLSN